MRIRNVQCLILASLVFGAQGQADARTVYVATDGDNTSATGDVNAPFRTIQKAINVVGKGDHTIYIRGGVYRERIELHGGQGGLSPSERLKLFAEDPNGPPVIKGSDLVKSGWVQRSCSDLPLPADTNCSGNVWSVSWPPAPELQTGRGDGKDYLSPQQVFVNDAPLTQIGYIGERYDDTTGVKTFIYANTGDKYVPADYNADGVSDLRDLVVPGKKNLFYYDTVRKTLYIRLPDGGHDPVSSDVEVAARLRVLFVGESTPTSAKYVHIKGLSFRHSNNASYHQQGFMVDPGDFSILEDCDVQWGDFGGAKARKGSIIRNCVIANNGAVGISGSGPVDPAEGPYTFEIVDNKIYGNNYRVFSPTWHAGGIKVTTNTAGTISNNRVVANKGNGIWTDGCRSGVPLLISGNQLEDNIVLYKGSIWGEGIFIEISRNAQVTNNLVLNSPLRGIYVSASDDTLVAHNTLVDTGASGDLASDSEKLLQHIEDQGAIDVNGLPRPNGSRGQVWTLRNNRIVNNIVYNTGIGDTALHEKPDLKIRKNDTCVDPLDCNGPDYDGSTWKVTGNYSNNNLFYRLPNVGKMAVLKLVARVPQDHTWIYSDGSAEYSLDAWRDETGGWDTASQFQSSPNFVGATATPFMPSVDSVAVDNGVTLGEVVTDKEGRSRPQGAAPDIGAYETKTE